MMGSTQALCLCTLSAFLACLTYLHLPPQDSQRDPCTSHLLPGTLHSPPLPVPVPGPVLVEPWSKPRSIPCISHSATVPYLHATTVSTLSILNLVVFPSTVADHPSVPLGVASLDRPWACLVDQSLVLFVHDFFPPPPPPPIPYTGPPSSTLSVARAFGPP